MIQILAALSQGGDTQNPLAASSKAAAPGSFVAMFAQALMQGVQADAESGKPVVAALPGHDKRLPELSLKSLQGEISLATSQATPDLAGTAAAHGLATAGEGGQVAADAEVAETVAEAGNPAAKDGTVAEDEAGQALLAMLGLPAVAQVPVENVAQPVATEADADLTDASEIGTESGQAGKKLPNPMAVLAVQQKALAAIQKNKDDSPAEIMGRPFAAAAAAAAVTGDQPEAVSGSGLSSLTAAAKEVPAPVAANAAANTTASGQEAALAVARSHEGTGLQGKTVLGMQSAFGSAAWQQELGDKLVWISGRQGQMAELVLNPPSLGAVEVRLNLNGSEASAQFFAANPQVRDALEAALPRLRELMGSAGIALGEAMVSDQSFGQRDKAEPGQPARQGGTAMAGTVEDGALAERIRITGRGLLDYFA
ncbi:MAG: hypothetical protein HGA75_02345 [Thiobacillus sp.]|nr:hypothetical protein [Thiobacillus sp.]